MCSCDRILNKPWCFETWLALRDFRLVTIRHTCVTLARIVSELEQRDNLKASEWRCENSRSEEKPHYITCNGCNVHDQFLKLNVDET